MLDQTVLSRSASPVLHDVPDLETEESKDRLALTYFYNFTAGHKTDAELSLSELAHLIRTTTRPTKVQLPWLKLARFGETRTDKVV